MHHSYFHPTPSLRSPWQPAAWQPTEGATWSWSSSELAFRRTAVTWLKALKTPLPRVLIWPDSELSYFQQPFPGNICSKQPEETIEYIGCLSSGSKSFIGKGGKLMSTGALKSSASSLGLWKSACMCKAVRTPRAVCMLRPEKALRCQLCELRFCTIRKWNRRWSC